MFLSRIVEWIDSLESGHQFRKWAALSVKISGVFTLVTTFVLGIAILTLVLTFIRRSGIVTQAFTIIGTFFGLAIIGIVGITMAMLFWDRAKKIASLGEESHLTRLLGEVAFIGFSGGAILFLVCSIFGALTLGWIVLVLLALSFLFHLLGAGILQFSYVIADISTNIKQIDRRYQEPQLPPRSLQTVSSDTPSEERPTPNIDQRSPEPTTATTTTAHQATSADTPSEGTPTPNIDQRSPEPTTATATTAHETDATDTPSEGTPTPNIDQRSPEIIAEQNLETHTNGYPYPESKGRLGIRSRVFFTLITCFIYGIFWTSKQMSILNGWLGRENFSFWRTVGLGFLTCGIYTIYTEYQMACSINEIRDKYGMYVTSSFPVVYMLSLFFTFGIGAYAIMQSQINKLYDEYSGGE